MFQPEDETLSTMVGNDRHLPASQGHSRRLMIDWSETYSCSQLDWNLGPVHQQPHPSPSAGHFRPNVMLSSGVWSPRWWLQPGASPAPRRLPGSDLVAVEMKSADPRHRGVGRSTVVAALARPNSQTIVSTRGHRFKVHTFAFFTFI